MTIDRKTKTTRTGFEAFSDLLSDIEPVLRAHARRQSRPNAPPQDSGRPARARPGGAMAVRPLAARTKNWVLAIGGGVALIMLIAYSSEEGGNPGRLPDRTPEQPGEVMSPSNNAPAYASSASSRPTPTPPVQRARSAVTPPMTDGAEQVPPPGYDRVLSASELRYCLSEKMRLDAADPIVDSRSEWAVTRFNAMVDDYNSRCGSFRAADATMARISREVELNRWRLALEGRNRF